MGEPWVTEVEVQFDYRCCEDSDFYEGVRATLVDRDNKPVSGDHHLLIMHLMYVFPGVETRQPGRGD